jgi:hypothetical protein
MEHHDLPTEILQGELESLEEAFKQRVSITLRQEDEFFTMSIPMGSRWRSESSARHVAELLWDRLIGRGLRVHMMHIKEELRRREASSSGPVPPG